MPFEGRGDLGGLTGVKNSLRILWKVKEGVDRALEGRGKGGEALGGLGEVWKRVGRMRGLRKVCK